MFAAVALLMIMAQGVAQAEPARTNPKSVVVTMTRRTVLVEVPEAARGCERASPLELAAAFEAKRVVVDVRGFTVSAPSDGAQKCDDVHSTYGSFELPEAWLLAGPARRELVVRLRGKTNTFTLDVDAKDKRLRLSKRAGANASLGPSKDGLLQTPFGAWAAKMASASRHAGDVVVNGAIIVKDNDEQAVRETFRKYIDDLRDCWAVELEDTPRLSGRAQLQIKFRGEEFPEVSVVNSELDELQAFSCFSRAVASWPFSVRTGSAIVPIAMKGKRQ